MPGFFYSSYGEAAPISAILMPQNQYSKLLNSVLSPSSPYFNASSPKQRLFIRVTDSSTRDQREDVINGLRTFFKTDATIVIDTRTYVETTLETVSLLDLFFVVIGVLAMIMCFFILWLSFTANVRENSWEFGVLRAIGVNSTQVVLIYVYEAIALVIASFTLGTIIGILIASSLTAQFNLFLEMPFHLTFPHMLFWALFILSLLVSIVGSVLPARSFLNSTISSVLRGQ
jgi:ABC-type antimicrobial peptide transport system permease subunit